MYWGWMNTANGWTGTHDDGEAWTGDNLGVVDAIRKHKIAQVGKNKDIFYQDEACTGTGGGNSSAASIILSTLFMMVMLF